MPEASSTRRNPLGCISSTMKVNDIEVGDHPGETCGVKAIFVGDDQVVDDGERKCEVPDQLV